MKLIEALELKAREPILITLIGGGGKTTTLFRLGEELSGLGESVVLTTTTAIFMPPSSTYDISIITKSVDEAKIILKQNLNTKRILLGKEVTSENKLKSFTPEEMDEIYKENKDRWFLVEGDGSNGRSLKIPDTHEPQVPSLSSITIILIGSDILGKEINKENVHRHHLIYKLIHKCVYNVDKNLILDLALHPLGITKGIPNNSKKIILFNKVKSIRKESFYLFEQVYKLSKEILQNRHTLNNYDSVTHLYSGISFILLGEVQDKDPILEVLGKEI